MNKETLLDVLDVSTCPDEKELTLQHLRSMQDDYIEDEGYERHPLPEWYALEYAINALEQESKTIQEKQAESEKYDKAFDDGYANGYAQARFDYEQEPCDDVISRKAVLDALRKCEPLIDYDEHDRRETYYEAEEVEFKIKSLPSVNPQNTKERDTSFINKPCILIGVCHEDKIKMLDKIRAEIEQNAYPIVHGVNNHEPGMSLYGILQVIDKYRAADKYGR